MKLVASLVAVVIMCALHISAPATLQSDVNAVQAAGATSVVARFNDHGTVTDAVAGTAQYGTNTPVDPGSHYRTGSITKSFVSTVILQLVGEGRMSLDDTVDHWLPGVVTGNGNNGAGITIRQLLQHTSGLFNYTSDSAFASTLSSASAFAANKDHQYTPQDLLNIALAHPPVFGPGTAFQYSNTGYIVAGMVIQAVTGNNWATEVTNRIITPLGLANTSIPGSIETLPVPFSHGYNIWTAPVYTDTTEDNMSWGDSAGAIITTTADETKFWSALMSGGLLPPAQLTQLKTTVTLSTKTGYGLGVARSTICHQDLWWHEGGTIGYETLVISTTDGGAALAYDLSTTAVASNSTTFTTATHSAEDGLVRDRFCAASSSDSITAQESLVGGGSVIRLR